MLLKFTVSDLSFLMFADVVAVLSEGMTTPLALSLVSSMLKVKASLASLPSTFFVACSVTFVGVRSLFV